MKTIAVTGYSGTGSSAVIDLLTECDNVNVVLGTKYEHSLLYFPNSIFDLKSKLIECNDPLRSDEAIKAFRNCMKYLNDNDFGWFGSYEQLVGNRFMEIVEEYISSIKQGEFDAMWYHNYKKVVFSLPKVFLQMGAKLLFKRKIYKWGRKYIIDKGLIEYSFISEDEFNRATKVFIDKYISLFSESGKINVFDHLLWPTNAKFIDDFFDDNFNLVIVKRDPRDLFFINKYFWCKPPVSVPGTYPLDVKEFCVYYKGLMNHSLTKSDRILEVNFEDLIYNFEDTKNIIAKFTGIDPNFIGNKRCFNPSKSIKNTQVFNLKDEWKEENDYIEQVLREYLYEFPYEITTSFSEMFD